jgi:hypothetical protein
MAEYRERKGGGVQRQAAGVSAAGAPPVEAASASAPRPALADEKLAGVAPGTSSEEVVRLLGEPHMRLTAEFERFTYRLESGGTARLEFEAGTLARVTTLPAR